MLLLWQSLLSDNSLGPAGRSPQTTVQPTGEDRSADIPAGSGVGGDEREAGGGEERQKRGGGEVWGHAEGAARHPWQGEDGERGHSRRGIRSFNALVVQIMTATWCCY